ncbi:MAG: N-acetyl-gamma-glutamyl-phosphate reductase, partial [Chitinophagaceae bacterium]
MKIKAGIVGGAGYTGGELIRLLLNHPEVSIAFSHSTSNQGNSIASVHTDLEGDTEMLFSGDEVFSTLTDVDVIFLCAGHGAGRKFIESQGLPSNVKVIDLSHDFRLKDTSKVGHRTFVYGLTELNREDITQAQNIANPGCFATCIQLGLLPLAAAGKLNSEVHINATTGSTGAGQGLTPTSHFSWRANNLSVYKAFEHQHLAEISESLQQVGSEVPALNFIPQRGAFARGILAAMYVETELTMAEASDLYKDFYKDHPFTHFSKSNIDLKQVVNTNKCLVHLEKHGNKLFIVSIIDNLLKGASGQAVEN